MTYPFAAGWVAPLHIPRIPGMFRNLLLLAASETIHPAGNQDIPLFLILVFQSQCWWFSTKRIQFDTLLHQPLLTLHGSEFSWLAKNDPKHVFFWGRRPLLVV